MELHAPGGPVRSFKDFLVHIGVTSSPSVWLFAETEQQGLSLWKDLRRFGSDAAAINKDQRAILISELRRYGNALIVVDFAGQSALRDCGDALK